MSFSISNIDIIMGWNVIGLGFVWDQSCDEAVIYIGPLGITISW